MHARRGFTLIEVMVVVAIIGILVSLAAFAFGRATRQARTSGARFKVINTLQIAKQASLARGADVYVVFSNLDSTASWPRESAGRVVVYEDADGTLRDAAAVDDIMATVNANPANIREDLTASTGQVFGDTGLAFVNTDGNAISPCATATLPAYLRITGPRLTDQNCQAFCTFCEVQTAGGCVGAVRFSSNGRARVVTGDVGQGGLVKLVDPIDGNNATCVAIAEPSGIAVTVQ